MRTPSILFLWCYVLFALHGVNPCHGYVRMQLRLIKTLDVSRSAASISSPQTPLTARSRSTLLLASTALSADEVDPGMFKKRVFSLGALVIQNTALILLMRMSRVNKQSSAMYIASTAVVVCEFIKVLVSIAGYYADNCKSNPSILLQKCRNPNIVWLEVFTISIPAFLYVIQNNLQYFAVSNLPADVYQVLIQGKIITTAIFSAVLLNKRYSWIQWSSVFALAMGVGLVQLSLTTGSAASAATALISTSATQSVSRNFQCALSSKNINFAVGIPSVLISTLTSGFAAVYLEKMLKRKEGFWARNIQLSAVSLMIALVGAFVKDAGQIAAKGFLFGYNPLVFSVILTQALGGMLVAFVVRYSNSVMKGFATSGSIILSCFMSALLIQEHKLSPLFSLGALIVSGAAAAWAMSPQLPAKPDRPVLKGSAPVVDRRVQVADAVDAPAVTTAGGATGQLSQQQQSDA